MLSWELMSQLFLFVMSSVEDIYLLNVGAVLSIDAASGHSGIQHQSDCSSLLKRMWDSETYLAVCRCILKCAGFCGVCWLSANWMCEVCRQEDLHFFCNSCLMGKSWLHSAGVRGDGPWLFLELLHLFACLCVLTCSYGFLSKSYCINNMMLCCKASLSLCYFVQPSLTLKYHHCMQHKSS